MNKPSASLGPERAARQSFIPREHGATAMLLIPFFAAAVLIRRMYWPEFVALVAVAFAFSIKEPLVVIARQRFVWKQEHPESSRATRAALLEVIILSICGAVLLRARDWRPFMPLLLGGIAFTILAVVLNVRNRQRSEWFQVASAVALSATSLAACLAATSDIPSWGWRLWLLCSLQASAGIFVVHARLDARIAAKQGAAPPPENRRAAFFCLVVMIGAAGLFAWQQQYWIFSALLMAAIGHLLDLFRQNNPAALQIPLSRVGRRALALSVAYTIMVVIGLW